VIPRLETCATCRGTGAKTGSQPVVCKTCRARARCAFRRASSRSVRPVRAVGERAASSNTHVRRAGGWARPRPSAPSRSRCRRCGDRYAAQAHGEGEAGVRGGPPGDLYVVIGVQEHAIFTRHGDDMVCEIPVSITQAALGRRSRSRRSRGGPRSRSRPGPRWGPSSDCAARIPESPGLRPRRPPGSHIRRGSHAPKRQAAGAPGTVRPAGERRGEPAGARVLGEGEVDLRMMPIRERPAGRLPSGGPEVVGAITDDFSFRPRRFGG